MRRTAAPAARGGCRRRTCCGSTTRSTPRGEIGAPVERIHVLAGERIPRDRVDREVAAPCGLAHRHRGIALDGETLCGRARPSTRVAAARRRCRRPCTRESCARPAPRGRTARAAPAARARRRRRSRGRDPSTPRPAAGRAPSRRRRARVRRARLAAAAMARASVRVSSPDSGAASEFGHAGGQRST